MFLIVYKQNSRDRTLAKQLHFHHRVVKVQIRNNSAVKWVVLVTCVFLLCCGIFLHCSLLFLIKYGNGFLLQNTCASYKLRNKPNSIRFLQKKYKARIRKASPQKASLFNNRIVSTQEKH